MLNVYPYMGIRLKLIFKQELIEPQAFQLLAFNKFFSSTTLIDFCPQLPDAQFPVLLARAKPAIAMVRSIYSY